MPPSHAFGTPNDIVALALACERLEEMTPAFDAALASNDPWMLNAGILAISHAARRFKSFPGATRQQLWQRVHDFPDAQQLAGSKRDADGDIAHFKARAI